MLRETGGHIYLANHSLGRPLKRLTFIAERLNQDYLLGAGFSVPDAYLFVMLMWARKNGLSLPVPLPAYFERMKARPRQPFATHTQGLASPVSTDAPAGQLTRGSFKTIPASEETTNTQRFEEDSWLTRQSPANGRWRARRRLRPAWRWPRYPKGPIGEGLRSLGSEAP